MEKCPDCQGAGELYIPADTVNPQPQEWPPCVRCGGTGEINPQDFSQRALDALIEYETKNEEGRLEQGAETARKFERDWGLRPSYACGNEVRVEIDNERWTFKRGNDLTGQLGWYAVDKCPNCGHERRSKLLSDMACMGRLLRGEHWEPCHYDKKPAPTDPFERLIKAVQDVVAKLK